MKASNERARIPVWAMPIVAALPLWGLVYAGTLNPPVQEREAYAEGRELYEEHCASCHGAEGGGGTGYAFSGGAVVQTFPNRYEQILHIARGSAAITNQAYGNPGSADARVAGERGIMPAFGPDGTTELSLLELELITLHERHEFGGEAYGDPENGEADEAYIDHLEELIEEGVEEEIDLAELQRLADEAQTVVPDVAYPTQAELDAAGFNADEE